MSGKIPTIGTHRGVALHDGQSSERVERVVQPEIDAVFAMTDLEQLAAFAANPARSPESRLFAAAKCRAAYEVAVNERRSRPTDIDMDSVAASVAALNSAGWRSATHYGSILDVPAAPGEPGAAPRPKPFLSQIEQAQRARQERERAEYLARSGEKPIVIPPEFR